MSHRQAGTTGPVGRNTRPAMITPKAQRIWTFLALITVGSTIVTLLASNETKAGSIGCSQNSDCGCTVEHDPNEPNEPDACAMFPESGFCNTDFNTCTCNSGFGGTFCCPGNGCSGNGFCNIGGICDCFPGFIGTD